MHALVTGGGGFLGREITRQLRQRGDDVTIVGRQPRPTIEALGAKCVRMDLTSPGDLRHLCEGIDVVFHTAAKAGIWGTRESYYAINVRATERLLAAARSAGVSRFVHTSSPSVVFERGHDALDASEDKTPYPESYTAFYPETKAIAERFVIKQNARGFVVTALRPHYIWGPGDPHLLPRVIDRHRTGRLFQIGSGTKVSLTFIENAAKAHLQACDALDPAHPEKPPAGRAYFVTDDEPVDFWAFISNLLEQLGEGPVKRKLSPAIARAISSIMATAWETFNWAGEPPMTPFVVDQLAQSHWYSSAAAKRDFGYSPDVGHETALRRTIDALQDRARLTFSADERTGSHAGARPAGGRPSKGSGSDRTGPR
jgi:nucleoside-diphosphate-sugar epimerase